MTNRVVLSVPITNHNENLSIWPRKRNWNNFSIIDNKGTKATRGSLETKRREVKETSNLILDLELICPIPIGRNWTICAKDSILPRVTPHLNPRPATNISHKFFELQIHEQMKNKVKSKTGTNHERRRPSSNSLYTFTITWLLVVTLMTGPGNFLLIAITCNRIFQHVSAKFLSKSYDTLGPCTFEIWWISSSSTSSLTGRVMARNEIHQI